MSHFLSHNRLFAIAVASALATSLSAVGPAEAVGALDCQPLFSHAEGFHPNKTQALANAVKAWSIRVTNSYSWHYATWSNAAGKSVNCAPSTGGLILCKVQAKPCKWVRF